ncbi:16S rRNA (uracil(1498)-N(3))-methyltransferase [Candidatus Woesearchaeota archaeon]|nr:MAG: 16S rRNA (uracil(1498)-N(3))-methyltransferase [Candidatus Woesearchaeota archaeon]
MKDNSNNTDGKSDKRYKRDGKERNNEGKVRVRLYIPDAEHGKKVRLDVQQQRHLKVLRVKKGERIRVFDGRGREFEAIYSGKVRDNSLLLEREIDPLPEPGASITLATAVPKGKRADFLVEKVSELGVSRIIPIIYARSSVIPRDAKIERLRKIATEACAQSGRSTIPEIEKPITFAQALEKVREYNKAFLCHLSGELLQKAYHDETSIIIFIGPEGDFAPSELEAAQEAGIVKVRLGSTIQRVETAAISAVSQLCALCEARRKLYK